MVVLTEYLAAGLTPMVPELDRDHFLLKPPCPVSFFRATLRAQCKLVLHLARDALFLAIELGRIGHVETTIGVQQRDHQRIFQLAFAQAKSPARASNHVRRLRHRFHAARQHNIGLAHLDHMCRADDSLHPRTAQTVYRECRRFDGQSRPQRNMPRGVDPTHPLLTLQQAWDVAAYVISMPRPQDKASVR